MVSKQEAVQTNQWVFLIGFLVSFFIMMVLAYNDAARRIYPYNVITLVFFTLSFGFLVSPPSPVIHPPIMHTVHLSF